MCAAQEQMNMRGLLGMCWVTLLAVASPVSAQELTDRIAFGEDVHVRAGERVNDVVAFGGDVLIEGDVLGDVAAFGGDAVIRHAVAGDVISLGGQLEIADGVDIGGRHLHLDEGVPLSLATPRTTLRDGLEHLAGYLLLFVIGLTTLGAFGDRMQTIKATMVKEPGRMGIIGVGGFLIARLALIGLTLTLIGIPLALAGGVALWLAVQVGLASGAAVIGAVLPIERLRHHPVPQLAAGVLTLYIASLVPFAGGLLVAAIAVVGLGAVIITLHNHRRPRLAGTGDYRTAAYPDAV